VKHTLLSNAPGILTAGAGAVMVTMSFVPAQRRHQAALFLATWVALVGLFLICGFMP